MTGSVIFRGIEVGVTELERGTLLDKMVLHYTEFLEEADDATFVATLEDWIAANPWRRPGAWRDLPGLRDPDRFDAWLRRVLVRTCLAEAEREVKAGLAIDSNAIRARPSAG